MPERDVDRPVPNCIPLAFNRYIKRNIYVFEGFPRENIFLRWLVKAKIYVSTSANVVSLPEATLCLHFSNMTSKSSPVIAAGRCEALDGLCLFLMNKRRVDIGTSNSAAAFRIEDFLLTTSDATGCILLRFGAPDRNLRDDMFEKKFEKWLNFVRG